MNTFSTLLAVTLALGSSGVASSSCWAKERAFNGEAQARFLKSVPAHATLAQIKKLLPRSTKYSAPQKVYGHFFYGNMIGFKGKTSGMLVFLSPQQFQKRAPYPTSPPIKGDIFRYRPTDRLNFAWVTLDDDKQPSLARDKTFIQAATKSLGKPSHLTPLSPAYNLDDEEPESLAATWKLAGGREIRYSSPGGSEADGSEAGEVATGLTLTFPSSYFGD